MDGSERPELGCCDACPAPAAVTVRLSSGGGVVLCGSHARRHASALLQQGAVIVGDYSWQVPPAVRTVYDGTVLTDRRARPQEQAWADPRAEMGWFARLCDRFLKPHEIRNYPRPT